ncbi:glycosyltransferase [Haladaptatus sp.]|uniref:glycosyltransferase n=1 Tax=Haladaptatus sp. TaxID=1973141 RepID=UPI003C6F432D
MKVLQLVTTPRPFFDLQIRELEERNIECTTVTVPRPAEGGRSITDYLRFYPKVLRHSLSEYDLVHANYGLVTPFALAQPIRPLVITFWGTDLMSENGWLPRLSTAVARQADAVILPTKAMAANYSGPHSLIPFGVDTERFRPIPKQEARERIGWKSNVPIVLFPYDTSRDVKDFTRAKRIVEQVDVDADLRAVSGVPYDEIPYYMNASDVLLVSSKREAGPMVVKEAAACNLPVISTDVGFVREVLDGVSNCTVSDVDRELVSAVEDVLARDDPSDGRTVIDGLSVDEMADSIVDVYDRVLTDQGSKTTGSR